MLVMPEYEHYKILKIDKETRLFQSNHSHCRIYRIRQGHVLIDGSSLDGKYGIADLYGPDNWFGPGLTDASSLQSATAKPGSVLEIYTKPDFEQLLSRDSTLALSIIQQVSKREQALQNRLLMQQTVPLKHRLAHVLVHLFAHHSEPCTHGHDRDFQLSQHELAAMVGGSRQSVSQLLADWRRDRVIDYTRDCICLENLEQLQALCA